MTAAPALRLALLNARMAYNALFRAGRGRRAAAIAGALLAVPALMLAYAIAGSVFATGTGGADLTRTAAGALAILCGLTAVTSVTFALSSLYFGRDLELLLSSPLPAHAVVRSRMLTQLGLGAGLGLLIAGGPLLALCAARGVPFAVVPVALAALALASVVLILATAVVVGGVRLIPARHVRDAGGLVVTLAVVLVAAVNVSLRGGDALTHPTARLDVETYGSGWAGSAYQPIGWAARAVAAFLAGDAARGALWLLPLIALACAAVAAVPRLVARPWVTGWERNAGASRGRRRDRTARTGRIRAAGPLWVSLALKDLREVRRDASQLGQLLLPLVMFALYVGAPGRSPADLSSSSLPPWYGVGLTAAFASLFSASGIALRGIGSEGNRIWVLRAAPLPARQLLAAKYAVGWVIAFALGMLLLVVGSWRFHGGLLAMLLPALRFAVVIAGLVGIATGLGAVRPRLTWTDPRRAIGIGTTLLFLAGGSVYLTICFVILALPYAIAPGSAAAVLAGDGGVVLVAVAAAATALTAGARRLERLET